VGEEMVVRVRDSIGSIITTPTTPTSGTSTPVPNTLMELLPYIGIAIVAVIAGICIKQKR
jgi:hypothetical protein